MKSIEFRVWDTLLNKYVNYHGHMQFDNQTYVFEQYSGIKDIDGNKIFEGDIVDIKNNDINKRGEVRFMRGTFIVHTGKQIWTLADTFFGFRKVGQTKSNESSTPSSDVLAAVSL